MTDIQKKRIEDAIVALEGSNDPMVKAMLTLVKFQGNQINGLKRQNRKLESELNAVKATIKSQSEVIMRTSRESANRSFRARQAATRTRSCKCAVCNELIVAKERDEVKAMQPTGDEKTRNWMTAGKLHKSCIVRDSVDTGLTGVSLD